ncbi:sugar phosphate isomerase/epimerase family protein [Alicyclobacillus macrosporangiidus]|uniref:Sugar phosphate isomerase/epimerase n=1 Tax=Alicyclobacillus macrosporangiidus TaxID=392015 RepID=A0A1I7L4L5_9BACL|nr:sugar phosphate isomerase/epimerase [Alicyclobacillus macrosporangiidus]SFV04683.1 Sugar phosphate isomerase/epimerase [Alicyclobacillus macrosporangiidus]
MSNIALQMYTLKEECKVDLHGTLAKIEEIGYEAVELAGTWGLSVEEAGRLLKKFRLRVASAHVPFVQLETQLETVLKEQEQLGNRHIVCPSVPVERRQTEDDYKRIALILNEVGRRCAESGFIFSYHNHNWELTKFGDRTGLDILFEQTDPDWVKAELDVYWLKKGGEDPVEWLARLGPRTLLVHLKDMTLDEEQFFAELGTGGVDLVSVVREGHRYGVEWWIVEQDRCRRPALESVNISLRYAREYLLPLLA